MSDEIEFTGYIHYLKAKLASQSHELEAVYELCQLHLGDVAMDELSNISTNHDTYKLDDHFAEDIAAWSQNESEQQS